METIPHTATNTGAAPTRELPVLTPAPRARRELPADVLRLARHAGLLVVIAVSALLNIHRLSQNGYANIFYSAGVKSMLRSLNNFLFVSFDPGGLIAVDKPPLALWLQAASAKAFGFSPMSLLLPEAIIGVLTVVALYLILARRLGAWAAFAGSLALAVFPSFVAVSRDNGVDPLLILLMLLACGAALRACERGRLRWLLASAVLVGLAFNTKTLAAYLVVPGIALGFLVCAPGGLLARVGKLLLAGAVMVAVSFAWIAYVEATPASKRPYVGGSTDNTQLGLTFGYNGFGRVEGQQGGPGQVKIKPGARVPAPKLPPPHTARERAFYNHEKLRIAALRAREKETFLPDGRYKNPIPFGSRPSPVRLFGKGLGDQDGWQVPFALFGLIALALVVFDALRRRRKAAPADAAEGEMPATASSPADPAVDDPPLPDGEGVTDASGAVAGAWRHDPRLAVLLVLGGWFAVEALVLDFSKGIVHPYYVSALAPATGAMMGAGVIAIAALRRGPRPLWGILLGAAAMLGTVAVQILLLEREHYLLWFIPVLVGAGVLGIVALAASRRLAVPATAFLLALTLVVPAAYSRTTWTAPVEGTFPAAGPKFNAGEGGLGVSPRTLAVYHALTDYAITHNPGTRWTVLTVASDTAAPMILEGYDAGALGGYSGTDPSLDARGLARLVRSHEARYVLLGGAYSTRGGNSATQATLKACRQLRPSQWHSPDSYPYGLTLFDCAGRERALESA